MKSLEKKHFSVYICIPMIPFIFRTKEKSSDFEAFGRMRYVLKNPFAEKFKPIYIFSQKYFCCAFLLNSWVIGKKQAWFHFLSVDYLANGFSLVTECF